MKVIILRNEVKEVLERIARQKQADIGGSLQECYNETLADYKSGVITDELINFALKHTDAQIVLDYGGKEP